MPTNEVTNDDVQSYLSSNNNGNSANMTSSTKMTSNDIVAGLGMANSMSQQFNTGNNVTKDANGLETYDKKWFQTGAAKDALSGANMGATVGTEILPGWGTAIGAVVGGVAGGVVGAVKDKKEKNQIAKDNRQISLEQSVNDLQKINQQNAQLNEQNLFSQNKSNYNIQNGVMYQNGIPLQV
jgi:hypothetical protein